MPSSYLFIALDVGDQAFHVAFFNPITLEKGYSVTKPRISALLPKLEKLQVMGSRQFFPVRQSLFSELTLQLSLRENLFYALPRTLLQRPVNQCSLAAIPFQV